MLEQIEIYSDSCRAYFYPEKKMLLIAQKEYREDYHIHLEIWNIDEEESRSIVSRIQNL